MTLNVEIYEMEYSCSPGGVDCWEANVDGYDESKCYSDFKTAGQALDYILDQYPAQMLELTVTSLKTYNKEMEEDLTSA
jgi:hypothetical protein